MAKTNPFLKGMTESEVAKLRRKAPYVDQVYNPETNEVHYDVVLNRLKDTSKKISDVEANFINQVKRNLQREYWRQGVAAERLANGEFNDASTRKYVYPSTSRLDKQKKYFDTVFGKGKNTVADYPAGFDNFSTDLRISDYFSSGKNPSRINQFMPEDYRRYRHLFASGYMTIPFPSDEYTEYYPDHRTLEKYYMTTTTDLTRDGSEIAGKKHFNQDVTQTKSNMTTLEKIFNSITSGVENVNRVYAENKERKEQERQNAINRAIKAEAAVASYQRKEKFDREQFDRALAEKDKAYNERFEQANAEFKKLIDARDTAYKTETAKRTAEFDSWRKSFESSSIEQAKQQAEQHTREMSQLRAESVRQAQDLANAKVENERIKSQNAILLKNNTRRRIALKQMGNIGLNFVGAGQRDSQSTALLSVLAGKNRYVPVARRFNEYGRFVESRGDTAVPDTFLSLISPQPQNRSKK